MLLSLWTGVRGAEVPHDTVSAQLISSADTVYGSQPFLIGVKFKIAPGWHIYWRYAGDAGLPTGITWNLPKGWSVGPVLWPLPQRFTEKGPLTTYGYVDSVLLMAQVIAPAQSPDTGDVALGANVDWLMCRESCVPGKATLSHRLSILASRRLIEAHDPPAESQFAEWTGKLPLALDSTGWLVNSRVEKAGGSIRTVKLTLNFRHKAILPSQVISWFPAPTDDFGVKNIRLRRATDDTEVSLSVQSFTRDFEVGDTLESVLIYRDSEGAKRGIRVATPLTIQSQTARR